MPQIASLLKEFLHREEQQPLELFLVQHEQLIVADIRTFFRSIGEEVATSPDLALRLQAAMNADGRMRQTWSNCVANQIVQPLRLYRPTTLNEVKDIIVEAEEAGCRVRAIGSGHSFSDVVQTTDFLVDTHGLGKVLGLNTSVLKAGIDTTGLVQVECGITIHNLNIELEQRGRALANMGAYDAQTIIGAISTATHGSGITLGPLSSIQRSIVIVGDGGQVYRIEPTNGITDPVKYAAAFPANRLIQDDEWFNTASVSIGCLGVVYSIIIDTVPKYWLKEERYMSDWVTVKAQLQQGDILRDNRHVEVLVNPYSTLPDNNHKCLVTIRNISPPPVGIPKDQGHRNFFTELLGDLIGIFPDIENIMVYVFNTFYSRIPIFIDEAMKGLVDDGYTDISYKVLNLGSANNVRAFSSEIGFPMCDNTYIAAVEGILDMVARMRSLGQVYLSAPFSLRFVRKTDAYLAMMQGSDTCMIEMPMLYGTFGAYETLRRYQDEMFRFSGRPHWGQVNNLSGANGFIGTLYPKLDQWMAVYRQLNTRGTFDNAFTDRVGFSAFTFNRACR